MSTPVALLTPLPLKIVVDSVLGDKPLPGFMQPVVPEFVTGSKGMILILGVALVMIVALLAQLQRIGSLILQNVHRREAGSGLSRPALPPRPAPLALVPRLEGYGRFGLPHPVRCPALQWIVTDEPLIPLVTAIVTLVRMIYVTARIDLQLALVALAVSPSSS